MTNTLEFEEITMQELMDIDGGTGLGIALVIIGSAAAGCAWQGFLLGCAYEAILG